MSLIAAVNFIVGALFFSIGAWPIAGFAGLDVLLMWWAFRANFADARKAERISISDHDVTFERFERDGSVETRKLIRRWTRVELEEDVERELIGSLRLVSGRTRIIIGSFLSSEERKSLATALKSALALPRI
jgi:uncharacterized membrane protein